MLNKTKQQEYPLRILISGIGRSGTTLMYQQLARLLLGDGRAVNFRYEPYLWNIHASTTRGNSFGMSQLHFAGIQTHMDVPMFLEGPDPLHDPFIDHLFNEPLDTDPARQPDAYLTKIIRGSGRLRSYLARYPDLKIVACVRNPLETINSSLGMFSFFGEEFHVDDRPRFHAALAARGMDVSGLGDARLGIEWYGAWWRAFTRETLSVAADHPQNVFVFHHEAFQHSPQETLDALMDFIGVRNNGISIGLDKPAGATIKASSLTSHDIRVLAPDTAWYFDSVLAPVLGKKTATARADKAVSRYRNGNFSFPLAGGDPGQKTPIQLRAMMVTRQTSAFLSLVQRAPHPVSLPDLISHLHKDDPAAVYTPSLTSRGAGANKSFGVVLTCYNNVDTIADAVVSCLNQTRPFDEIVVVNDKSTDRSAALLGELAARYSSIKLLDLTSNIGPAGARDAGIRALSTDFFTQLDGDDLFWPTKNEQEAATIAGDTSAVAFSDIFRVTQGGYMVLETAAYAGKSGTDIRQALLARTPQVPRDMTLSRDLYFAAGGYDVTLHLHEDWEFKLRLAQKSSVWKRADAGLGTVYNCTSPGLSDTDDGIHARKLSQIFLRSLRPQDAARDGLLTAYDAAIGKLHTRHVAQVGRDALCAFVEAPDSDITALANFMAQRDMSAKSNPDYITALEAFVARTFGKGVRP